jgi:hypothetical protein
VQLAPAAAAAPALQEPSAWQTSAAVHTLPSASQALSVNGFASNTQLPLFASQLSTVQALLSSQTFLAPAKHVPALHASPAVHASPSASQLVASGFCWPSHLPSASLQLPSVQPPAEQSIALPWPQLPPASQTSPTVQNLPSLQAVPAGTLPLTQPLAASVQLSCVHVLLSLQSFAGPAMQPP